MHADAKKKIFVLFKLLFFVGKPWTFSSFPKGLSIVGKELCLLSLSRGKTLSLFLFLEETLKKNSSLVPSLRLTFQKVAIRHTNLEKCKWYVCLYTTNIFVQVRIFTKHISVHMYMYTAHVPSLLRNWSYAIH